MQQTVGTANFGQASVTSASRKELFLAGVWVQLIFVSLIGIYWFCYRLFVRSNPNVINTDALELLASFMLYSVPILIFCQLLMSFWHMILHVRPKRPTIWLYKDMAAHFSDPRRLALGMPMVLLLNLFMDIFTDIKKNIPNLIPFSWDPTFMEWDRFLHFGKHPWEWLQPVLGYWPITFLVNFSYNFWFLTMWMLWMYFAFTTYHQRSQDPLLPQLHSHMGDRRKPHGSGLLLGRSLLLLAHRTVARSLCAAHELPAQGERHHSADGHRRPGCALVFLPDQGHDRGHYRHAQHAQCGLFALCARRMADQPAAWHHSLDSLLRGLYRFRSTSDGITPSMLMSDGRWRYRCGSSRSPSRNGGRDMQLRCGGAEYFVKMSDSCPPPRLLDLL